MPAEQLIQHHAQRIDIAPGRDWILAQLLGAGVAGSEQHHLGHGLIVGTFQQLSGAKVEQLHQPLFARHQDIRGLQVAVNDQV